MNKKGYRLVAPVESIIDEPSKTLYASSSDAATSARILNRLSRTGKLAFFITLLIITTTAGALFWLNRWKATEEMVSSESKTVSIAVLPFDNLSGDPEDEYFADGITDDLITGLVKNPALLVIAWDSTFFYKGQLLDVRQIAEKLAVYYILNGSVHRVGERVRINAQLVDATTEGHLWAESYDGELSNIFELQDEISQKDELYFKVDDHNPNDYECLGLKPSAYSMKSGRKATMNYYPVPADVLEDPDRLSDWAGKDLEAVQRGKKASHR